MLWFYSHAIIFRIRYSEYNPVFIGQTKRSVIMNIANVLKTNNYVSLDNIDLIKSVSDERSLDAYEYAYIKKNEDTLNLDNGNIDSVLFSFA